MENFKDFQDEASTSINYSLSFSPGLLGSYKLDPGVWDYAFIFYPTAMKKNNFQFLYKLKIYFLFMYLFYTQKFLSFFNHNHKR